MVKAQIESDLKAALLGGDKRKTTVLRGLKSAILYEEVALNKREEGLSEDEVTRVMAREAKKRQEAATLYEQAKETERAGNELYEKGIIENYLPKQLSEDEVTAIVDEAVASVENPTLKDMGAIIGAVRAKTAGAADGALIARLVKEWL